MILQIRKAQITALILPCLLICAFLLYQPGENGNFFFDDYPTLESIGANGGIHNIKGMMQFLTSGDAGPSGRPLSLLSFLIDANDWPASAQSFKRTNILLHLLNATLVCWLSLMLARMISLRETPSTVTALLTTAIWLLHPLHASTVMVIVQRMTELMAAFVLAGMIAYLHGRKILNEKPVKGYLWMSAGIAVSGILATLSKENGVLLLIYVGVIESFLLQPTGLPPPPYWKRWATLFLAAPIAILCLYFAFKWPAYALSYSLREFSPYERLLSETRVLSIYIKNIILPSLGQTGIYHDSFPPSRGFLSPPSTLISSIFLAILFGIALRLRNLHPVISLGIIWFFAGHLLESTFLPLELFFEHRNYVPMVGPFFALAYYVTRVPAKYKIPALSGIALYISLLGTITYQSAQLWGNTEAQAEIWAQEQPHSIRAQQSAAQYWTSKGDMLRARNHFVEGLKYNPTDTGLVLQLIQNMCAHGDLPAGFTEKNLKTLRTGARNNSAPDTIKKLIGLHEESSCPQLTIMDIHAMIDALLANPHFPEAQSKMTLLTQKSRLYRLELDLNNTVEYLNLAYNAQPKVDLALLAAYWLTTAGLFDKASEEIQKARQLDTSGLPWQRGIHAKEIDSMERYISQSRDRSIH